ncbi:hypothetical protein [Butyricimonas faecalis]|nr:hypothetical protein [Butyricimonas faecalis]
MRLKTTLRLSVDVLGCMVKTMRQWSSASPFSASNVPNTACRSSA